MSDVKKTAEVLALSEDMMLAVIEQRWDDLSVFQLQQNQLLKALFDSDDNVFSVQEKQDLLEVQRLTKEVLTAAETLRSEIGKKLREMHLGKSKANAYQGF